MWPRWSLILTAHDLKLVEYLLWLCSEFPFFFLNCLGFLGLKSLPHWTAFKWEVVEQQSVSFPTEKRQIVLWILRVGLGWKMANVSFKELPIILANRKNIVRVSRQIPDRVDYISRQVFMFCSGWTSAPHAGLDAGVGAAALRCLPTPSYSFCPSWGNPGTWNGSAFLWASKGARTHGGLSRIPHVPGTWGRCRQSWACVAASAH